MIFYKAFYRKKSQKFQFYPQSLKLSEEIKNGYKTIKSDFLKIDSLMCDYERNYNPKITKRNITNINENIKKYKKCLYIFKSILNFYNECNEYMSILIDELFKYDLNQKKSILKIFNKILKIFYIFDIRRHKNIQIFNDFSFFKLKFLENENNSFEMKKDEFKNEKLSSELNSEIFNNLLKMKLNIKRDNKMIKENILKDLNINSNLIHKFTLFSSISMPMAQLFLAYFNTDCKEVFLPNLLDNKKSLYLDKNRKEFLYFLICILINFKNDFLYVFIYFSSIFIKFYGSEYFQSEILNCEDYIHTYYYGILMIE